MKATGIVRRIDDLGRVVIPKEIRRTMRIREGDPLEIYTTRDGEVIFKKYSLIGGVGGGGAAGAGPAAIEAELSAGRDVAMVNLGDVSVYATAYYILERIRADEFETVMCPGVTSFCAVAARLGRSLTRMEEPLHILPGSTDLDNALPLPGTKVVMKSGKAIYKAAAALERHGLLANAGMVADCGLETEQIYTDLRQLPEKISYFATIVAD